MPGEWVEIVNVDEPTPPVELEVHPIGGGDVEDVEHDDGDQGDTDQAS